MRTRRVERSFRFSCCVALMTALSISTVLGNESGGDQPAINRYGIRSWNPYAAAQRCENGKIIEVVIIPASPPPENYRGEAVELPALNVALGITVIPEVPAFNWCYGCTATSAAMAMGYYDRMGYPNMYIGPSNGGVCPLNNETYWPNASSTIGECPLSVTHAGKDGRVIRGHVDDYWIAVDNLGPDPFVVNGWPEHAQGECTGDYMGTSQSKFNNPDGYAWITYYHNGDPLYDRPDFYDDGKLRRDACHGLRLFVESRGYSVDSNYSQYIKGWPGTDPGKGFTFADFQAEIDAGYPVIILLVGHSMLGFGYNRSANMIYIHDTWDHSDHQMAWGGSYGGRPHQGVTVCRLAEVEPPPPDEVQLPLPSPTCWAGQYYGPFVPDRAFDGDTSTFWITVPGDMEEWIAVDLGARHTVTRMSQYAQYDPRWPGKSNISSNEVQFSDDNATWTTVVQGGAWSFHEHDEWATDSWAFTTPVINKKARYVKINTSHTFAQANIYETRIYVPRVEVLLNGDIFGAGSQFQATFQLNGSIAQPFTAYAVVILPNGSMLNALTLKAPIQPVVANMQGLDAPFSYPLINRNIPGGAPKGEYEIVAAFFDPSKPIHSRADAFLDVKAKFTIQ